VRRPIKTGEQDLFGLIERDLRAVEAGSVREVPVRQRDRLKHEPIHGVSGGEPPDDVPDPLGRPAENVDLEVAPA